MAYKRIEDRQKIIKIIDHLISTRGAVSVTVKSAPAPFTSMIINADQNHPSLAKGTRAVIIIDKLAPERGNSLIQSSPKVTLRFEVTDQPCSCTVNYIGTSSMPPHFGFMLTMPEVIELGEKRIESRVVFDPPDFLLAEICIGKGTKDEKSFELSVVDCAAHGLGMLVPIKHLDLLERVKTGDVIKDICFYASNAMLRVDGTVRHITKIGEGKFKGSYYIGIESKDIIPSCKASK
jgi:hypothetical protein